MNAAELKTLSNSIRWHRKEIHATSDENTKQWHRGIIKKNILVARVFYGYNKKALIK